MRELLLSENIPPSARPGPCWDLLPSARRTSLCQDGPAKPPRTSCTMRRMKSILVVLVCLTLFSRWLAAEQTAILEPSQVIEAERGTLPGKPPVITAVAIRPGGGLIATAGDDHAVRLWSTTTGRIVQTLKGHSDWVRSLAFSPDGESLASG
ncbi:MAG: hypothetical protein HY288_13685, partial [Planctomycetia bacterium]|nr:hypothetical protein [Planctomycetia bacterium]